MGIGCEWRADCVSVTRLFVWFLAGAFHVLVGLFVMLRRAASVWAVWLLSFGVLESCGVGFGWLGLLCKCFWVLCWRVLSEVGLGYSSLRIALRLGLF